MESLNQIQNTQAFFSTKYTVKIRKVHHVCFCGNTELYKLIL